MAPRRGMSDAAQFVQRPQVSAFSAFAPWAADGDAYQQLLPTAAEVRGEVAEQRKDKPWYVDAFEFLDQLTFGQAIRGFAQGLAPGGPGPFEQFFKNLPLLYYATGEDVQSADIREAWGDTNAREGVKNAVLNTVIDIASNPLLLFGQPLAVTKAGMAAATAAGVSRYGRVAGAAAGAGGAAMKAEGLRLLAGLESIGKGLEQGQRAMYVFNMFGKELFSLGKVAQGVNPHGFQSMYIASGNLIDSFFAKLHTNPLLKPISGVFTFATGIGDPLKRAMFGGATKAAEAARNRYTQAINSIYEASTTADMRHYIVAESGAHPALLTAAQIGFHEMDRRAAFATATETPHLFMGNGRKNALLREDPHFVATWTKAMEEAAQPAGMGTSAIRELYQKYNVPLDEAMLIHANLPGRVGIEVSPFDSEALYRQLRGAEGGAMPMAGSEHRAQIAAGVEGEVKSVVAGARAQVMSSYDLLAADVASGKVAWSDVQGWLKGHADAMEAMSEMDRIGGVLGTSTELAVGPQVHKLMNPRAAKIIDRQIIKAAQKYGGEKAVNIISSFMRDQHYASMTTIESNAIFWNLGTKLTAFRPLKELAEKDLASHSLVDRVAAKIFDLPFVKALRRSKVPGDAEMGQMFLTNPVLNDYDRIWEAAQQHGARAAMAAVFEGPLPMDKIDLGRDAKKILDYDRGSYHIVIPNPMPAKIMETREAGGFAQDVMVAERRAAAEEARAAIRANMTERIDLGITSYVEQEAHFRRATKLNHATAAESDLIEATSDNIGVALVKKRMRDLRDSEFRSQALRLMQNPKANITAKGTVAWAEPPAATIAHERASLDAAWDAVGAKERGLIEQRVAETQARIASLDKRMAEIGKEMPRSSASDPELRSWQMADGPALAVERGRIRQARAALARVLKDNEAMLVGKYANKDAYIGESIVEKVAREKELQTSLKDRIGRLKDNLTAEADSIQESIDLFSGQEKFRAKQSKRDVSRAMGRKLAAMDMNLEMRVVQEAKEQGGLALFNLPESMQAKYLGRDGVTAYVFKKDEWEAVQGFWKHWSHADDWGQNKIVAALRQMRTVWAPYVAANGLGLMSRVRDAVTAHMVFEFGGAWRGLTSRIKSYKHADQIARGWLKTVDEASNPAAKEAFSKGVFKSAAGPEFSYPEILQYAQSHGLQSGVSMMGEVVTKGGDMMELAAHNRGKFTDIFSTKGITDFPAALFPYKKATETVYGRQGLRMAQFVDDRTRMAGFFGKLDETGDLAEATDFALKWSYDSRRNLTTLERQRIATFIPFYSWAKFAISRSVETFFKTPGRISWIEAGRRNFMKSVLPGETEANPDDIEAILPSYIAQQYGIPFRNGAKGPEFLLLGSWLPTGEIQQMVTALTGGAGAVGNYIGQKMHPAVKAGIEMAFNHSFFKGKDVVDYEGQPMEIFGMAIPKRLEPLWNNVTFLKAIDDKDLLGVSESQALRHGTATEDEPSWLSRLGHSVFGVMPKTYPQSIEQAVRNRKRVELQELGKLSGLLRSRAEHPERKLSADESDALRKLIRQGAARVARMEGVSASFPEDQPAQKRKRRKFGPMTESLTP